MEIDQVNPIEKLKDHLKEKTARLAAYATQPKKLSSPECVALRSECRDIKETLEVLVSANESN
jgi:hypothetical protein